jgi:urea transporter
LSFVAVCGRRDTLPVACESEEVCMTSLHTVLATFSYKSSRRLIEAGLLVGLVGGLGLAVSGRSRGVTAIAGLLLAVGLGLVLVVVHFGVSPFRHR